MADIAARYDARREQILDSIRSGECSSSMSGIEYYPRPWAELDLSDEGDLLIVSVALTWNGIAHDLEGLRRLDTGKAAHG